MATTTISLGGELPRRPGRGRPGRRRLLYEVAIDQIEQLIVERDLGPGDKIPSHDELSELTGVSMITVRRALEELERDGILRRHQGLGTFVSGPKIMSDPSRTGGLGDTLDGSADSNRVGTKVLDVSRSHPSKDLAAALQIHPTDQVWRVHRQRSLGTKPLIVETALIPVALAPDLDQAYRGGSLYETLATRYGLDDDYEEQVLDVIHATADVRSLLRLNPRALVVRIRGITRDTTGMPFDAFEQVYSASEFAFSISGKTNRQLHRGDVVRDWSVTPLPGAPSRSRVRGSG